MLCGPSPSPNLGPSGMLQGPEPAPRSLRAHLGGMPCAYGPFGDMWGSGSLGILTVATLPAEDSQKPTLPSHLGPVLDRWGQSLHTPLYFLTVPGLGFPTTSSMEQRLLLGPGLPGVYPSWVMGKVSTLQITSRGRLEGWSYSRAKVGVVSDPPGSPDHTGPGGLLYLAPGLSLLCLSHI